MAPQETHDWSIWTLRTGPRAAAAGVRTSFGCRRIVWSKIKIRTAPVLRDVTVRLMLHHNSRNRRNSRILQELFSLWIVFGLDLLVVHEILLPAFVIVNLEAMAVKSIFALVATDIVDHNILLDIWSGVGLWFSDISWSWRAAVRRLRVIVQYSCNIVLLRSSISPQWLDNLVEVGGWGALNYCSGHSETIGFQLLNVKTDFS